MPLVRRCTTTAALLAAAVLLITSPAAADAQTEIDRANWMRNLGTKQINQLSLPGTHDTMAYRKKTKDGGKKEDGDKDWTGWVLAQKLPLSQQLLQGVRWLDVRVGKDDAGEIVTCHGGFVMEKTLAEAFQDTCEFLAAHESETVFVMLKEECSAKNVKGDKDEQRRFADEVAAAIGELPCAKLAASTSDAALAHTTRLKSGGLQGKLVVAVTATWDALPFLLEALESHEPPIAYLPLIAEGDDTRQLAGTALEGRGANCAKQNAWALFKKMSYFVPGAKTLGMSAADGKIGSIVATLKTAAMENAKARPVFVNYFSAAGGAISKLARATKRAVVRLLGDGIEDDMCGAFGACLLDAVGDRSDQAKDDDASVVDAIIKRNKCEAGELLGAGGAAARTLVATARLRRRATAARAAVAELDGSVERCKKKCTAHVRFVLEDAESYAEAKAHEQILQHECARMPHGSRIDVNFPHGWSSLKYKCEVVRI